MENDYIILDFLYSVNNEDYYMNAITVGGDKKIVKLSKKQFIQWCKAHENDEQGFENSLYLTFVI